MKKPTYVVGLDINEFSVKVALFREEKGERWLQKVACFENPQQRVDPTVLQGISDFLHEVPRGMVRYYASAFGSQIVVRRLHLPMMGGKERLAAAKWAVKESVPFSIEEARVDCVVLGEVMDRGAKKLDVLVVVAAQEVVEAVQMLANQLRISLSGILVPAFAILPFAEILAPSQPGGIVVIDLGDDATGLHVFLEGRLEFTREIALGGRGLTEAITEAVLPGQNKVISVEEAEAIKRHYGIPAFASTDVTEGEVSLRKVAEMMRPILERLLNEVLRSLDYFKQEFRQETLHKIYLTGGGSLLKGFDAFLAERIGIPVHILAIENLIKIDPKVADSEAVRMLPRYGVAVGIGLAQGTKVNLLHRPEAKRQFAQNFQQVMDQLRWLQLSARGILLFLFMVFFLVLFTSTQLSRLSGKLEEDIAKKDLLLKDLRLLSEKRSVLAELKSSRPRVRELLATITHLLPDPMVLSELSYDRKTLAVKITGLAHDEREISTFFHALSQHYLFRDVVLGEIRKEGKRTLLPYTFQFNLTMANP